MPIWISILEYAVKALIWMYGHKAVMAKVTKYTPLPADPTPKESEDPNITNHFGGL